MTGVIAKAINSNTWLIAIALGLELFQYLWVLKVLPDTPPLHDRLNHLHTVPIIIIRHTAVQREAGCY